MEEDGIALDTEQEFSQLTRDEGEGWFGSVAVTEDGRCISASSHCTKIKPNYFLIQALQSCAANVM